MEPRSGCLARAGPGHRELPKGIGIKAVAPALHGWGQRANRRRGLWLAPTHNEAEAADPRAPRQSRQTSREVKQHVKADSLTPAYP